MKIALFCILLPILAITTLVDPNSALAELNENRPLNPVKLTLGEYEFLLKGIIAEAAGEGYDGIYAVACCVRNRILSGMDYGLTGLKRKDLNSFVRRQPDSVKEYAIVALQEAFDSDHYDVTNGALYFESTDFIENFKQWKANKIILAKIGKHYFYNYKEKHDRTIQNTGNKKRRTH